MQDMILLGFLLDGEKTGYEVKKLMETSTSFFFNTSLGSIYPAFRKLEARGLVRQEQTVDNGRVKNSFSITDTGRQIFLEWMQEGIAIRKVKEEALLKIFFFSQLPESDRARHISDYIKGLEEQAQVLREIRLQMSDFSIDPFRMKTLEFGIEYYDFLKAWHHRFLSELDTESMEPLPDLETTQTV